MSPNYFYKDKPLFGLDIGFGTVKVMQIESSGKKWDITGYGVTSFDPVAIKDGVILDPEVIAKAIHELFEKHLIGEVTSRRVAMSVPAAQVFSRVVTLPLLAEKDLDEAIRLEAEQYIPVPLDGLYMDYEVIKRTDKDTELLAMAIPKNIVDSYTTLVRLLGLEVVTMESTISADSRVFVHAKESGTPTVLIDFGSISADITIYDKALLVTGTVPCGGDVFSKLIADTLKVTAEEAQVIKNKYGLGVSKKQPEITAALGSALEQMLKEIRRMIRYYEERSNTKAKIGQIVTLGGGANMPGLSEWMTDKLRLPVRMCNPWQNLDFGNLQPPHDVEKSMYATVAGLALIQPKEIFA